MKPDPLSNPDADLSGDDWERTTNALRRVARSVGASAGEAEDVAQGALLAGFLARARGLKPGLGWLKTHARHRTIDGLRQSGSERRSHDVHALEEQHSETLPPPAMAAQFEVQRRVMAAVEALPEPYRETVFLRYFEGLAVPEIARLKGAPIPTVRTWLTRAHGQLREQLLESGEGRSPAWIAAFHDFGRRPEVALPPLPAASPFGPILAVSFLMSHKALLIAVGVLVALGLGYQLSSEEIKADLSAPILADTDVADGPLELNVATLDQQVEREALPSAVTAAQPSALPAPEQVKVHGRVLDEMGAPIDGFLVRFEPPLPGLDEMTTATDGRFSGETTLEETTSYEVVPVDERFVAILSQAISPESFASNAGALLVVAPRGQVLGSVHGAEGEVIDGASILLALPTDFSARLDDPIQGAELLRPWSTRSGADGSFEYADAPSLAGCSLTVNAPGYQSATLEGIPAAGERLVAKPLGIVLEPIDPSKTVRGVVLDPNGAAVPGAWVALGDSVRRADDSGGFRFELANDENARSGSQRLLASADGWIPVEFSPATSQAVNGGSVFWPEFVELRFQRESLSIEGVVLDVLGEPAAGHYVWVDDMTRIGLASNSRVIATEALGAYVNNLHKRYRTDAQGRFRIENLSPRNYKLVAMDPETFLTTPRTEIAAGDSSAAIKYDESTQVVDLVGRVVDRSGAPVKGATLAFMRFTIRLGRYVDPAWTDPVETGADGKFQLSGVPLDPELELSISGAESWRLTIPTAEIKAPYDDLVFTLDSRCEVKVDTNIDGDLSQVASFQLRDAAGEVQSLRYSPEPGSYSGGTTTPLVDGVSFHFYASDAATEIAFLDTEGETLSAQSVRLVPGELNKIQRQ